MSASLVVLSKDDRIEIVKQARTDYYNELMGTYRKRSENLSGRKVEFLKKDSNAGKDLLLIVGAGVVSGATAGGVVGAIVGGVC